MEFEGREKVKFYFSFSDPYSFLITPAVKGLTSNYKVEVEYIPISGFDREGVFSENETVRRYYKRDVERYSAKAGRKLSYEAKSQNSLPSCRARFFADETLMGIKYINLVFGLRWLMGKDISTLDHIAAGVKFIELDEAGLKEAFTTEKYAAQQNNSEEDAVKDGVIGTPFIVFRGEAFYGPDRLDALETVLKSDPSLIVYHDAGYAVIKHEEFAEKMKNKEPLLVLDVRIPKEFAAGHIPGANCLPAKIVHRNINRLDRDWTIVLVDDGGVDASETAFLVAGDGFKKISVLSGGMKDWKGAVETGLAKWQDKIKPLK
ncbi:MAG: DsbA family protein [Nitrospinae bacterium]|nr:DsbA family protein [Nitrospinota bacterium]